MSLVRSWCKTTVTQGQFRKNHCSGDSIIFGPNRTELYEALTQDPVYQSGTTTFPVSDILLTARMEAVLLLGTSTSPMPSSIPPTALANTSASSTFSGEVSSSGQVGRPGHVLDRNGVVGVSVGSTIIGIILSALGFYILRRYRKRRQKGHQGGEPLPREERIGYEKSELEGSYGRCIYVRKAELGADAVRAELEGQIIQELEEGPHQIAEMD